MRHGTSTVCWRRVRTALPRGYDLVDSGGRIVAAVNMSAPKFRLGTRPAAMDAFHQWYERFLGTSESRRQEQQP